MKQKHSHNSSNTRGADGNENAELQIIHVFCNFYLNDNIELTVFFSRLFWYILKPELLDNELFIDSAAMLKSNSK